MTSCSKMFSSYSPCAGNKKVKPADGSISAVAGMGTIKLTSLIMMCSMFTIYLAICYPSINLLLIINLELIFSSYCVFQKLTTGRMIGNAKENDGLYYFDDGLDLSRQFQSTRVNFVFVPKENDIMLWHYRLGHPNFQYLKYLFPNIFKNKSSSSFQREVCQFAKHHRASFSP